MAEAPKAWAVAQFAGRGQRQGLFDQIKATHQSFGLKEDPVAHERYKTMFETQPNTAGEYTSLHYMMMSGEAKQVFHYHPPHPGDPQTSKRWVYIMGLPPEGATFQWFDLHDATISKQQKDIPTVTGKPGEKMFRFNIPPFTAAVVSLDAGVHVFGGNALAVSLHPKDIKQSHITDTLVGNTALYEGPLPNVTVDGVVDFPNPFDALTTEKRIPNIGVTDLGGMAKAYGDQMVALKETTKKGPSHQPTIDNLIETLRAIPQQCRGIQSRP